MSYTKLIGMRVMNLRTKSIGTIVNIEANKVYVSDGISIVAYPYPAAFSDVLQLEDEELQEEIQTASAGALFNQFRNTYSFALNKEIEFLKETGGKKYRVVDGELISQNKDTYIYSFDTDSELHFPDGTTIKIQLTEGRAYAYVISCEDFSITFQTSTYLGKTIAHLEFTAEPWQLLEGLLDRIYELDEEKCPIAYSLVCDRRKQVNRRKPIERGQNAAMRKSSSQPITFVWGPPGTGKTYTLARVALDFLNKKKRILMVSYSNVSVDRALLRVDELSDYPRGTIVRYGYPRERELLEEKWYLTSYAQVLDQNPALAKEYYDLLDKKKKLKRKSAERQDINKKIASIRTKLRQEEQELVQRAGFVATTISKAVVDKAIYSQTFDIVIFDEASMAYVPQVVFAASLAKSSFYCLGDFRQLPAIVQNPSDSVLKKDIFNYTEISSAVENGYGHNWLVMLDDQHRMHPEIARFASRFMYEGMLNSPEGLYKRMQVIADINPLPGNPIGMVDLSDTYSVCIKTNDGSRINLLSAMMCMHLAEKMFTHYGVGIITPYSAQSRLILAMIRDLQERNPKYSVVSSATVHQFQGSEKPVIIYDAVDCFRMPYLGMLLGSVKDDTSNRLFNVALTRTQGKFILVANRGYLRRKKLNKKLLFDKLLRSLDDETDVLSGEQLVEELGTYEGEAADVFFGDRDEEDSWNRYINDIKNSTSSIVIDLPGPIDNDDNAVRDFVEAIKDASKRGVVTVIRIEESIILPQELSEYAVIHPYITTPFTIIDQRIIWFGEPLSAADFISEGEILPTEYFPCLRFEGKHTARILRAFYQITNEKGVARNEQVATGFDS